MTFSSSSRFRRRRSFTEVDRSITHSRLTGVIAVPMSYRTFHGRQPTYPLRYVLSMSELHKNTNNNNKYINVPLNMTLRTST